jgi:hypothetical protein
MAVLQCGVLVALATLVRMTTPSRPKLRPLPEDAAPLKVATRLAHAHRGKLLVAALTAFCTLAAIASLIDALLSSTIDSTSGMRDAAGRAMLVIVALSLTLYLFFAALRRPAEVVQPTRTSPWD